MFNPILIVLVGAIVIALVVLNVKKGDNNPDRKKPWIETPMLFAAIGATTILFFALLFYWLSTVGITF